ncbi:MAG TPA: DUF433 domain-containing protein [Chloroflexota bacterium]|nr:DUF433 domain-containing protein [Chloroflexota bacterium]
MAYIRTDDSGVMRVGETRVSFDSVVIAFQQGYSPESIRQQNPALSLEEVYGAITYYLANRATVEEYLRRQDQVWDQARQDAEMRPSAVVQRLRSLAQQQTTPTS